MAAPDYPYVALEPITVNGILGYQPGDFVPESVVENLALTVGEQVELRDVPEGSQEAPGIGDAADDTAPNAGD